MLERIIKTTWISMGILVMASGLGFLGYRTIIEVSNPVAGWICGIMVFDIAGIFVMASVYNVKCTVAIFHRAKRIRRLRSG